MIRSGLFISAEDFRDMDPVLKSKLQDWLDGGRASTQKGPPIETPDCAPDGIDMESNGPCDLSFRQAKRLLEGCGEKTKSVLRAVFSKETPKFILDDIAKEMNVGNGGLGGSWAGITKRTRTVLDDPDARLFWWEWDEWDEVWTASSSEMTHQSMRKALGIE